MLFYHVNLAIVFSRAVGCIFGELLNSSPLFAVSHDATSGSAAGAGTSKGSTTGAGAAGAAAGGGGKAGSSWSAIANEAGGGCAARRNLNGPFTELRRAGQEAAKALCAAARRPGRT